jgi:hypothetical protein
MLEEGGAKTLIKDRSTKVSEISRVLNDTIDNQNVQLLNYRFKLIFYCWFKNKLEQRILKNLCVKGL